MPSARTKVTFIVLAVVAMLIGGVAYASIPDGSGVIHGCYKTGNPAKGAVTVVDSDLGESCPSGTTSLNWSQTGPQGPAGATGITGATGPAGANGVSGYTNVESARTVNGQSTVSYQVPCPTGKVVVGGGVWQGGNLIIAVSGPFSGSGSIDNTGWRVIAYNPTASAENVNAVAICAAVTS